MTVIVKMEGEERVFDDMLDAYEFMDATADFDAWEYEGMVEFWPEHVHEFRFVGIGY